MQKYYEINKNLKISKLTGLCLLALMSLQPSMVRAQEQGQTSSECAGQAQADSSIEKELKDAGAFLCEKKYAEAAKLLKDCLERDKKQSGESRSDLLHYWLADSLYLLSRYDEAGLEYEKALALLNAKKAKDGQLTDKERALNLACLRGKAACLSSVKNYAAAEPYLHEQSALTREIFGGGNINYGWSLLNESENLAKLGKTKDSQEHFRHAIYLFRKCNMDRIMSEYGIKSAIAKETETGKEVIRKRIWRLVFGTTNKKEMPTDLMEDKKNAQVNFCDGDLGLPNSLTVQTEAPGWVWINPHREPAGIIICVHGLGLHHRSFDSFAKQMIKEGFIVIAFDVRGFGSYLSSQGQEKLDLDACVNDLKDVVSEIKGDFQDQPLFMLGESMGGAIALRFAAKFPELTDGVVCAVPASKRYKAGTTALTVALHYVSDPNRPFAIGKKVVEQSTSRSSERQKWKQDPSSRLELTPKELLAFQKFMNENTFYAKKITHTPVIVFQGDEDRLVKKSSTYALFDALATKQKTLVVIGGAEHLIFEAPRFKEDITSGIVGWLQAHGARCEYLPPEFSPKRKTNKHQ